MRLGHPGRRTSEPRKFVYNMGGLIGNAFGS